MTPEPPGAAPEQISPELLRAAQIPAELLHADDLKACCAELYANPALRWLLGDQLHPGGEDLTRSAFDLIGLDAGQSLLDVASGPGAATLLAVEEYGCDGVGLDAGADSISQATESARERGLATRARFVEGDATALPFAEGEFDAALCECSLCLFEDKRQALAEIHRVLRPGGSLALSDVVVDRDRAPRELLGPLGTIACVGAALSRPELDRVLADAGFEMIASEDHSAEAMAMAERIGDRLRGARILGFDRLLPVEGGVEEAMRLLELARRAIAEGSIGYLLIGARRA